MGFALTSGVNLYATVAILGLAARYHWVALPPQYSVFASDWVIGFAAVLYLVEFVADKIPCGRFDLGQRAHRDPPRWRRARRRGHPR